MLDFKVNGKLGEYELHLPTEVTELTDEFFENCAKQVEPADYYSLIALVYKQPLAMILNSIKKRDGMTTSVIPMFIKSGVNDNSFIQTLKPKDKLVIAGSLLSTALHVNLPANDLSIDRILAVAADDNEFRRNSFKYTTPCVFVDFKIISNSAINAVHVPANFDNAHIVKINKSTVTIN